MKATDLKWLVLLAVTWGETGATPLAGVLQLDSFSFNKTTRAFPWTVVKFDAGHPTGDKHKVWGDLAMDLRDVNEVGVAEVRVKDYGDKANQDLAERFGLTKEMFPEVILFRRKGSSLEEHRFGADFTKDQLIVFLKQKTGVYLNLPGCLRKFDSIVRWYLRSRVGKERDRVLERTEKEVNKETDDKAKATKYLKLMRLVHDKGEEALKKEEERVRRLVTGEKMSVEKRVDLEGTLNVIKSFERIHDPRDAAEARKMDQKILEGKEDEEENEGGGGDKGEDDIKDDEFNELFKDEL